MDVPVWWLVAAYAVIAALAFVGMARHMEPLDRRAWLSVLLLAIFWPASLIWFVLP